MAATLSDLSGQIIKGYELHELIGQGGFGAVYRAYQAAIDRDVAVKIILPDHANNPSFIRRFEAEAQVIARLEHLHIVPLYDYWREPNSACLVMRWMRGGSLQDSIDSGGPWDLEAVAHLLDQIASGLTAAHRNGIIHRDIKPANILLDEERNAYLADFGIAKILRPDRAEATDEDRFGSPAYISPEQVTGQPVSPQTDIYSLGVVIYMCLTGRTPFLDPSTTTIMRRHLNEALPPLQSIRPELPHALNIIIWRATSKRPEGRYPDVNSLAADFHQVVAPESSSPTKLSRLVTPTPRNIGTGPAGKTLIVDIPIEPDNPYKGLRAFQEADVADFFGRSTLVDRLIRRLSENTSWQRFLAIVGPSGSGKSSVARAGLVPAIRRGALTKSQDWFVVQMIPGPDPIGELAQSLMSIAVSPPPHLDDLLRSDEQAFANSLDAILPVDDAELVLVVDQFEEIFTLVTAERDRIHFMHLLLNAINMQRSRVHVIITLRADFYDRPLLYPEFGDLIRLRTEIILPLTSVEMEQAIVGPAERIGLRFEPGLVSEIITDVRKQPGALPLLQYALTELFDRRDGYILTRSAYANAGGVLGALARRADELYEQLDTVSKEAARQMFLRLVTLGDGTDDTRRRVFRAELGTIAHDRSVVQRVLDVFGKYRLLTFDYEPTTRAPTVEIAHEALIRVWKRLRDWLEENREELAVYRKLTAAATDWMKTNRDPSFLATGSRLAQFEVLVTSNTLTLSESESGYLWASIAARQRSTTRLRLFVVGLIVFAVVAITLALFAFDRQAVAEMQRQRADQQAHISRSRELAITSITTRDQNDLALLLALEAMNASDTFEARNSLLRGLQAYPEVKLFLGQHNAPARAVAVSPDGKTAASGGRDNLVLLWDIETGHLLKQFQGHTDWVNTIAFAPDGRSLASAGSDGTIRLWDIESGAASGDPIDVQGGTIWSLAYSPDASILAAGDETAAVSLWNPVSQTALGEPLLGHEDIVYSLVFSKDGTTVFSASGDRTIRAWDVLTQQAKGPPLEGHSDAVLTLALHPSGTVLASSGADRNIVFWNTDTQEKSQTLATNHTDWVRSIAFSDDGQILASGSADHTIHLWNFDNLEPIEPPLSAHADVIRSLAFRPGTHYLVSTGADRKVILWDINSRNRLRISQRNQPADIVSLALAPDETHFATAGGVTSQDDRVFIWNTANESQQVFHSDLSYITGIGYARGGTQIAVAGAGGMVKMLHLDGNLVWQAKLSTSGSFIPLAVSPDDAAVATGSDDGSLWIWDSQTGKPIGEPLHGHQSGVLAIAFSSDGRFLASGGFDRQIIVWDVRTWNQSAVIPTTHTDAISTLAWSPTGSILASGSRDRTISLWDVQNRKRLRPPLTGHTDWVMALDFSPDSRWLASGSQDDTIILWDVEQGEAVGQPLKGNLDWVNAISFAESGRTLISGAQDGAIMLFSVAMDDWKSRACYVANRNFTEIEWDRYFSGLPWQPTCPP